MCHIYSSVTDTFSHSLFRVEHNELSHGAMLLCCFLKVTPGNVACVLSSPFYVLISICSRVKLNWTFGTPQKTKTKKTRDQIMVPRDRIQCIMGICSDNVDTAQTLKKGKLRTERAYKKNRVRVLPSLQVTVRKRVFLQIRWRREGRQGK